MEIGTLAEWLALTVWPIQKRFGDGGPRRAPRVTKDGYVFEALRFTNSTEQAYPSTRRSVPDDFVRLRVNPSVK